VHNYEQSPNVLAVERNTKPKENEHENTDGANVAWINWATLAARPAFGWRNSRPRIQTPAMTRFKQDMEAQKKLSQTVKLSDMKSEDFDTIFYVGGHGPMWDLVDNPDSIALIESFYNSGKPVAAVCHSPGVFHRVTYQGEPLVKGKRVTGFTNGEEAAMNLTHVVLFLVEDELKRIGVSTRRQPTGHPSR
jgi:putative intracellular protease/amidase